MENNLDVLQGLHTLLAEYFKRELEASMEEDGFPIPSATLGVIVTFLKNNNITADIKDGVDIDLDEHELLVELIKELTQEIKAKEV